jgi:hypothetical protein
MKMRSLNSKVLLLVAAASGSVATHNLDLSQVAQCAVRFPVTLHFYLHHSSPISLEASVQVSKLIESQ